MKIAGISYVNLNSEEDNALINLPNNVSHLLNKKKKINLLQSIKDKAEHLIIRKRYLLERLDDQLTSIEIIPSYINKSKICKPIFWGRV